MSSVQAGVRSFDQTEINWDKYVIFSLYLSVFFSLIQAHAFA